MILLLDTHALIWALLEPDRLSQRAREAMEDPVNTLFVSSASAWEISTKHRLGRLPEASVLVSGYEEHLERLGAVELPITASHALLAGGLDGVHRDPFDRMLAAQAVIEGIPLVSKDAAFQLFPVRIWW